jgi:hypothetical protein
VIDNFHSPGTGWIKQYLAVFPVNKISLQIFISGTGIRWIQ